MAHCRQGGDAAMKPAILVTGAASGVGRDLARAAAGDAEVMLLVGLEQRALDEIAAEIGGRGVETHALCIDLADGDAGQRIEQELAAIDAYCDVLVNCAGVGVFGAAAAADRNAQLNVIDVNIRALTELSLRFLPGMIARRRGGVLNVGSITGYAPGPQMSTYF